MKFLAASIVIALTSAVLLMPDADARPLGGGKSIGMKRAVTPPPAAPAQSAVTPAKPAATAATPVPATPAPAPSGMSKWLGPLAGLAAGGLLASMFMGGGFGGIKMFDILLFAGLAFGAFMIWRAMARRKGAETGAGANTLQYAGATDAPYAPASAAYPAPSATPGTPEIGSRLADGPASTAAIEAATAAPRIPADFEVEPFLRQGRVAFIRLQDANDRRDLNDIRDFTTPEMYAELAMQIQERGNVEQRTEIVAMDAKLLEVVTEGEGKARRMIASVRFTGQFRDGAQGPVEALDEVWQVTKQLEDPQSTWLLAGIQQVE